jgi:hypothetical protein
VPLARIAPFAVVAVLAELSLILPPGWASTPAAVVSLVLLVAVPAMMLLRRDRMPSWTPVLVPLAYAGSVLALLLTVGSTSGVAIVILIPLIWTGLYHRRWESACVVAAIVAVEITVSLVPVRVGDAVLFRRRTVDRAGHADLRGHAGLRDSIRRAQEQRTRAEARLRELRVLEDRERIAADLQDRVVRRLHTAELALESAASMISGPRASRRIAAALQELDAGHPGDPGIGIRPRPAPGGRPALAAGDRTRVRRVRLGRGTAAGVQLPGTGGQRAPRRERPGAARGPERGADGDRQAGPAGSGHGDGRGRRLPDGHGRAVRRSARGACRSGP